MAILDRQRPLVFHLDGPGDLDVVALERVVDGGADLVARCLVAFVILDPESRPVVDRRGVIC